jgi:hypothetical protein
MHEHDLRKPIEVWLTIDDDGIDVSVYSQHARLVDS